MSAKWFPYHGYTRPGELNYTRRPLIDVEIGVEDRTRVFKALIDSGTEITVMDSGIGTLLGLNPENYPTGRLSGIEDWKEGYVAPISFRIDGFDDMFTFRVLFIEGVGKNFDILLGQQDFFRNFRVVFERSEKRFSLERVPEQDD
ncbi:MAG: hypothetical protein ACM3TU_03005 [Bacillota bacterium]